MNNPFEHVNWGRVSQRVENIRQSRPNWTTCELVRRCTSDKKKWAMAVGAVSNAGSVLPGVGGAVSLAAGTAFDLMTLTNLLTELICEIAVIHGRRPATVGTSREAFFVLASSLGADAATLGVTKYAVMHASKRAFLRLVQRVLARIGVIVTQKSIARVVPLIGSVVGGAMNASTCDMVSAAADRWYRENPTQEDGWYKQP